MRAIASAMQPMRWACSASGPWAAGTWDVLRRNAEEITRRAGRPIQITRIASARPRRARATLQRGEAST